MATPTRSELHSKKKSKRQSHSKSNRHNKKHKRRKRGGGFRTFLGVLLILFAVGLFALDPIKNYMIQKGQTQNTVANLTLERIQANKNAEATYNWDDVNELDALSVITQNINPDDLPTIGGIAIPEVGMNLPIYKGVSDANMYLGAGTLYKDQEMGESNYSLASHHSIHKGLLFQPLMEVEYGDIIYLTDLEYVYVYKIDNIQTVPPEAIEVTFPTESPILTLITCDSQLVDRVVVQASMIEKVEFKDATQEMIHAFEIKTTVPEA